MEISKQIKNRRAELGLTQEELAQRLSVARTTVSNWEMNRNYPDLGTVVKLSEELDISLDELLKGGSDVVEKITEDTKVRKTQSKKIKRLFIALVLTMGVSLGVISIVMGLIPNGIRQFTGLTVIGNPLGYLLGALIVAWINYQSWVKGFILSSLMVATATITYYVIIISFSVLEFRSYVISSKIIGLLMGGAIGVVVGILAATAVWMARKAKSRVLNYGIFAIAYLGLLGVIYLFNVRIAFSFYGLLPFESESEVRQLVGSIFEVVFSVLLVTVVLGIGFKHMMKESKRLLQSLV